MNRSHSCASVMIRAEGGIHDQSYAHARILRRIRQHGHAHRVDARSMDARTVADTWESFAKPYGRAIASWGPSTQSTSFCLGSPKSSRSILLASEPYDSVADSFGSTEGNNMDANTIITLAEGTHPRTLDYLRDSFAQIAELVRSAWEQGSNREQDARIADILASYQFRASLADALYRPTEDEFTRALLGRIVPATREVGGNIVPSAFDSALDDVDMGGFEDDAPSHDGEHHASSLCDDCPFRDSCDTYKREGASPLDSEDVRTEALLRFFEDDRKPEDMN